MQRAKALHFLLGTVVLLLDLQPLAARNLSRAQPASRLQEPRLVIEWGSEGLIGQVPKAERPVLRPPPSHLLSAPHPASAITLKASLSGEINRVPGLSGTPVIRKALREPLFSRA